MDFNTIDIIFMFLKGFFLEQTPVDRAKTALSVTTDTALAKALGLSQSVVGGYNRRQTVPLEQCIKIAERTGVSLDWLILGKGEMRDLSGVAQAAGRVPRPAGRAEQQDNGFVGVPLYDTPAAAGYGCFFEAEHVIQQVPFEAAWLAREGLHRKDLACLPIKGDSMTPGLIDGDIVLLNRARREGDGVFVLRLGEALRIKRLQWLADGSLRISSDNALYKEEILDLAKLSADQFEIIGMVHTKIGRVY